MAGRSSIGMHINKPSIYATPTTPFHNLGYGSFRLWNNGLTWRLLEPVKGQFDRLAIDSTVQRAADSGLDLQMLYTAGQAPAWATGGQIGPGTEPGVAYNNSPPDSIDDWVAYLRWVDDNFAFPVYEIWNEPNYAPMWSGTIEQLQALHVAAWDLLHPRGRLIACASIGEGGVPISSGAPYLLEYLTPEIVERTDIITYHNYVYPLPPEQMIISLHATKAAMIRAGAGPLPLWNTEYGWLNNGVFDDTKACAYVARSLLANNIGGAAEAHFYGMDFGTQIPLVDLDVPEIVLPAGATYKVTANFIEGADLFRFRQVPPLYTVDWARGAQRGRIFWCDDNETTTVDLSGYASGVDVLGSPIVLSSDYAVTMSPIFVSQ